MNELEILNKNSVNHKIVKAKTSKLVLKYNRDGILVIRCPYRLKSGELEEFVTRHLDWIKEHYTTSQPKKRSYTNNESYLFLGKEYTLKIVQSFHESVIIQENNLFIYTKNELNIPKLLNKWKKEQAEIIFSEILYQCFEQMKNELKLYPKLEIKKYLSRWGCCYPKRNLIILNIALIHAPLDIIKYVVFHELSHFKYMNHQLEFHLFLQKYCPNEKALRNELKKYRTDYE